MPPIGLLVGQVDMGGLFINLSSTPYRSLAEAQAAHAPTINYGLFLNAIVNFLIIAIAVFFLVRYLNRLHQKPVPAPQTKTCPHCLSPVPLKASVCAHCTHDIP
jgi:large conductance mechanosensitive channel